MVGLAGLSVPLAGVGVFGAAVGVDGAEALLFGNPPVAIVSVDAVVVCVVDCFLAVCAARWPPNVAAASRTPEKQSVTATKFRKFTIPVLEEVCFFIA